MKILTLKKQDHNNPDLDELYRMVSDKTDNKNVF